MSKTNPGRFFEDFYVGENLHHPVPRTLSEGLRDQYMTFYGSRFAIASASTFANGCGLSRHPLDELIGFHIGFGQTVAEISLNAIANLGYAECRFLKPVYPGETLRAESIVIGLKENSSRKSGIVWVRSTVYDEMSEPVLSWVRWVMVHKRDPDVPAPDTVKPDLQDVVTSKSLVVPNGLDFTGFNFELAGEPHRLGDYQVGEIIDHVDGVTLTDPEHMMATRLWQNTAKVHFNTDARPDGKRLIYGGHIISLARALSFNGLTNAQMIAAINGGSHANPALAGDTVYAWSEVLDAAVLDETRRIGAIRLRLVATKGKHEAGSALKNDEGKYRSEVLLDLDLWALMPT